MMTDAALRGTADNADRRDGGGEKNWRGTGGEKENIADQREGVEQENSRGTVGEKETVT